MKKKQKNDSIRSQIMSRMSTTVLIATLILGIVGATLNAVSTFQLLEQTMTETARIASERVEQELQAYSNIVYEIGTMKQLSDPVHQEKADHKHQDPAEKIHPGGFQKIDDAVRIHAAAPFIRLFLFLCTLS